MKASGGPVWLIGADGMLGRSIARLLSARTIPYLATDRELDITQADIMLRFARDNLPRWLINCAAYTDVDGAEEASAQAFALNEGGARNAALAAAAANAALLHISTDYVFDGSTGDYKEDAPTAPLNVYGTSKLAGERSIRDLLDEHVIVRTAWLFGPDGKNFVSTMLGLFAEREGVAVVADQFGSPTSTADLAAALLRIITTDAPNYGTYHCTNGGQTSWYGLAEAALCEARAYRLLSRDVKLSPISTTAYPTRARRPPCSTLSCSRIRQHFGVDMPPWQMALKTFIAQLARMDTSSAPVD